MYRSDRDVWYLRRCQGYNNRLTPIAHRTRYAPRLHNNISTCACAGRVGNLKKRSYIYEEKTQVERERFCQHCSTDLNQVLLFLVGKASLTLFAGSTKSQDTRYPKREYVGKVSPNSTMYTCAIKYKTFRYSGY